MYYFVVTLVHHYMLELQYCLYLLYYFYYVLHTHQKSSSYAGINILGDAMVKVNLSYNCSGVED